VKATILLAIALFLVTAPTPDPAAIAQATGNFIVLESPDGLQASDLNRELRHPSEPAREIRTASHPGGERENSAPLRPGVEPMIGG
jgi:hypothetical protein